MGILSSPLVLRAAVCRRRRPVAGCRMRRHPHCFQGIFSSRFSTGKRMPPGRSRIVGRMLQNFDVCVNVKNYVSRSLVACGGGWRHRSASTSYDPAKSLKNHPQVNRLFTTFRERCVLRWSKLQPVLASHRCSFARVGSATGVKKAVFFRDDFRDGRRQGRRTT